MAKKPVHPKTTLAEWIAAGAGLVLTLGVVGYTAYEGLTANGGRPDLTVEAETPERTPGGFVAPIVVRNASHATAASVEIIGTLSAGGATVEERRVVLTYVPGKGAAHGGLVFEHDPSAYELRITAGGYEEP